MVGYPDIAAAADEPAEVWAPPGLPVAASVGDCHGHPLTWGTILRAHEWLVAHASCSSAGRPAAYDSDDAGGGTLDPPPCPCTYHPVLIEARDIHLLHCHSWPGPTCGTCWAASCACGFVFDDVSDAAGRWPTGRLRCHACEVAHAGA